MHLIEDWRINWTSLRRFGVDSCKEFAVILSLTAYKLVSLSNFFFFWAGGLSSNNDTGVNQCVFRVLRRWRGEREGGTGSSQCSLIFCWFIDFQASLILYLPLSLFLAACSLLNSQSDSDESRPSGAAPSIDAAYFPPSSPHSSAMLCIQNAEISPGGFEQGIYCYRRGEGRKRASQCY